MINKGATEEQVKRFEKEDKIDLRMIDLAKANDQTYQLGKQKDFFEDFKSRCGTRSTATPTPV